MAVKTIKHIVVPVDGSDHAAHAAVFGAHLGELVGARVALVFAFPASVADMIGVMGYPGVPGQAIHISEADIERTMNQSADKAFSSAREAIGETTADVVQEILRGDVAEAIIDYARKHESGLIVVGSRGLSPMKELLLGSISDKVLRHAPCPVTVVR